MQNLLDAIKLATFPIHKEGYKFILIFAIGAIILALLSDILGLAGLVLTLWCIFFFRDPERIVPIGEKLIISPADGVVQKIEEVPLPDNLTDSGEMRTRVSIFLNVFNVHVNRVPADGTITKLHYHPGKFFNASLDKASKYNERQEVLMKMDNGSEIAFSQIAGLIARRIVCDLKEGQKVKAGERFGIIRFGSRMDVYLPKGISPTVSVGQTVIGGESIVADMASKAGRSGEVR